MPYAHLSMKVPMLSCALYTCGYRCCESAVIHFQRYAYVHRLFFDDHCYAIVFRKSSS